MLQPKTMIEVVDKGKEWVRIAWTQLSIAQDFAIACGGAIGVEDSNHLMKTQSGTSTIYVHGCYEVDDVADVAIALKSVQNEENRLMKIGPKLIELKKQRAGIYE